MVLHRSRTHSRIEFQVLQIGLNQGSPGLQHFHERVLPLDHAVHDLVDLCRQDGRDFRASRRPGRRRVRGLLRIRDQREQQKGSNYPVPNTHNSPEISFSLASSTSKSGGSVAVLTQSRAHQV
jgi:hypothetical protein